MGEVKNRLSVFSKIRNSIFEEENRVVKFVTVLNSSAGFGTYIFFYSKLFNSQIGYYCSISQKVQVVFGDHPKKFCIDASSILSCYFYKNSFIR